MLSKCLGSSRNVFKGWFFKVKQRSDFGNDYMSFALM